MEPANILFVIAFIGLPVAFGIWALMSRRELSKMAPPPARPRRAALAPERSRPVQPADDTPEQRTVQLPATPDGRLPQAQSQQAASEETLAMPMTQSPPAVQAGSRGQPPQSDETVQVPGIQQQPPPQAVPASPPPGPVGQSGTTEEFPIIGYPEATPQPEPAPVPAAPAASAPIPQRAPEPRPTLPDIRPPLRRPFYPPRYIGRSAGIVKRLTPFECQQFVAKGNPRER
jgi:hypothetical protein